MNTNPVTSTRGTLLRPLACCALLTLTLLLGVACARVEPRHIPTMNASGVPVIEKRFELHPERDYWNHWSRTVYTHPGVIHYPQPQVEVTAIRQWGQPDWIRHFTSVDREPVTEWLYVDTAEVVQFVGEELVYEGPITDVERVLLRRGYPDVAIVQRSDPNMRVEVYEYMTLFGWPLDDFHFSNGKLTQAEEGN